MKEHPGQGDFFMKPERAHGSARTPITAFLGSTYEPSKDFARLTTQMQRVEWVMRDGGWRTLGEIAAATRANFGATDTEAAISARLRDLRRPDHGSREVQRRRRSVSLHEYRVVPVGGRS